jgi:hypothetical protein
MGHISRYCTKPRNRTAQARAVEVDDDSKTLGQTLQVAQAIMDQRSPQQKADEWLARVAGEEDNINDLVLQALWKQEDFQGA